MNTELRNKIDAVYAAFTDNPDDADLCKKMRLIHDYNTLWLDRAEIKIWWNETEKEDLKGYLQEEFDYLSNEIDKAEHDLMNML